MHGGRKRQGPQAAGVRPKPAMRRQGEMHHPSFRRGVATARYSRHDDGDGSLSLGRETYQRPLTAIRRVGSRRPGRHGRRSGGMMGRAGCRPGSQVVEIQYLIPRSLRLLTVWERPTGASPPAIPFSLISPYPHRGRRGKNTNAANRGLRSTTFLPDPPPKFWGQSGKSKPRRREAPPLGDGSRSACQQDAGGPIARRRFLHQWSRRGGSAVPKGRAVADPRDTVPRSGVPKAAFRMGQNRPEMP